MNQNKDNLSNSSNSNIDNATEYIIKKPNISSLYKKNILKNIKIVVRETILDNNDNYLDIIYFGITSELKFNLDNVIFSQLNFVTNKQYSEWCSIYSYDISNIVEITLLSLIDCSKINMFSDNELADFIYKMIKAHIKNL